MLNREQLLRELTAVADRLFVEDTALLEKARTIWAALCADTLLSTKVGMLSSMLPVPSWEGNIDTVYEIAAAPERHHVISVDGSQIYPDRHQGFACYVINTGSVIFHYGGHCARPVEFGSIPYVFSYESEASMPVGVEYINGKRQELEFIEGVRQAQRMKAHIADTDAPWVLLFDGSLIFWHLEAKDTRLRDIFLEKYLSALEQLQVEQVPMASYISMPRSRELASIVRLYAVDFDIDRFEAGTEFDQLIDAHIIKFFVPKNSRTQVFKNRAPISSYYTAAIQPYFFYIHGPVEVGRVEIPAWIAHDDQLLNQISALVLNQMYKGHGYPIALAEAHEQAVIKGPDRDFFYHVLCKIGIDKRYRMQSSQKIMRKRGMGI